MPAQWTGEIVGKLHTHGVTKAQLADEAGYRREYVSMILNGKRTSPGAESKLKALVEAVLLIAASLGHAAGGISSRLHADETSQTGEDTTGKESNGYNVVLQAEVGHHAEGDCDNHEEDSNNLVLLLQVGHSAFAHVARNLLHTVVALVGLLHVEEELGGKSQHQDGGNGNDPE